ncbi:MAG TPA: hypothetical protein VNY32_04580 [Candidatus Acidoferrales bacterium]|nr:hypothetical protein [Candidatus Acidoferrales bacterium]
MAWDLITQVAGGMIHLVLVAAAVELIKILLSGRQSMLSKIRAHYFMGAQEIWLGSLLDMTCFPMMEITDTG